MTGMTATDALLAVAAATTRDEMHRARLALINTGAGVLTDIDRTTVISGDGTAGQTLLGGVGNPLADTTALRAARLQGRLFAALAGQCAAPTATSGRACTLPRDHRGSHIAAPTGGRRR